MKALYVVIANPIVLVIHVVALALRMPHRGPIVLLSQLTNLVVGQKARRLGEVAHGAIFEGSRRQSVLFLVPQLKCATKRWQAQYEFMWWTAFFQPV